MFPLAFVAGSLQGHWWGFISQNYVVWPIFFLMNVFIALKGTHFWFLFHFQRLRKRASSGDTKNTSVVIVWRCSTSRPSWLNTRESILERNLIAVRSVGELLIEKILWRHTRWYISVDKIWYKIPLHWRTLSSFSYHIYGIDDRLNRQDVVLLAK